MLSALYSRVRLHLVAISCLVPDFRACTRSDPSGWCRSRKPQVYVSEYIEHHGASIDHRFALATTFLQIAIALSAIALLTRKKWLQWGVYGISAVGTQLI